MGMFKLFTNPATVTIETSKDGGCLAAATGIVKALGDGLYEYAPTPEETNASKVEFKLTKKSHDV